MQIQPRGRDPASAAVERYPVPLLSRKYPDRWDLKRCRYEPCGCHYEGSFIRSTWRTIRYGHPESVLERREVRYYLATWAP